jgi:two-component system chemotaxis response regulator CheB
VLVVDDSPLALLMITRLLEAPGIEVVGKARDGVEGLAMAKRLRPDVICADYHMPHMNGLEMTQEIMREIPTPILVISCSVQHDDPGNIFEFMQAGALDVLPKPRGGRAYDYDKIKLELLKKVKVLAGVSLISRHTKRVPYVGHARPSTASRARVVAIGSSTGGPIALQQILSALPAKFPIPIICVQHISEGFLVDLAAWLASVCKLKVKVGEQGESLAPGVVYFAPDNANLKIDKHGKISITDSPETAINRPSITVTLKSVADYFGNEAIGVILTGMGSDGSEGLLEIRKAGGITLAQDEASSVVYGMPKVADAIGAVDHILPLEHIAQALIEASNGRHPASKAS